MYEEKWVVKTLATPLLHQLAIHIGLATIAGCLFVDRVILAIVLLNEKLLIFRAHKEILTKAALLYLTVLDPGETARFEVFQTE